MNKIHPNYTYTVRAQIKSAKEQLLWTTDTSYRIDPQKLSQTIRPIVLVKVGASKIREKKDRKGLIGIDWRVSDLNGFGVIDRTRSIITFSPDGKVSGSTGCNQFFGDYSTRDDRLSFGKIAMTRRACVPALGNQEARFIALLNALDRYDINANGILILKTSDGKSITANR